MKTRYYSEDSRLNYYRTTADNEGLPADLLQVGCLQRIADALEKMAVMNDLLTAEELGQRLRVQPSTIKRWSQEGMIPALRLTGKVIRFDFAEVVQALRSRAEARP